MSNEMPSSEDLKKAKDIMTETQGMASFHRENALEYFKRKYPSIEKRLAEIQSVDSSQLLGISRGEIIGTRGVIAATIKGYDIFVEAEVSDTIKWSGKIRKAEEAEFKPMSAREAEAVFNKYAAAIELFAQGDLMQEEYGPVIREELGQSPYTKDLLAD